MEPRWSWWAGGSRSRPSAQRFEDMKGGAKRAKRYSDQGEAGDREAQGGSKQQGRATEGWVEGLKAGRRSMAMEMDGVGRGGGRRRLDETWSSLGVFSTTCWGWCGKRRRASSWDNGWGMPDLENISCGPRGNDPPVPKGGDEHFSYIQNISIFFLIFNPPLRFGILLCMLCTIIQ